MSRRFLLGLLILWSATGSALGQGRRDLPFLRSNPKFLEVFKEPAAEPRRSTVRILCDGKDTSLGMVVDADGWILTKADELQGKIDCRLADGRILEAKVVGVEQRNDLALLRVQAKDLVPVRFAPSKLVAVGDWIACVGPDELPVAVGVVGVATRKLALRPIRKDLSKSGYLGIGIEADDEGLRIMQVLPKTAAEKAGVKSGDLILALNGKNYREPEDFIQELGKSKPGDTITLKLRRGEEELELRPTLGKRDAKSNRSEMQNMMGSELSNRRTGYDTILQHDSIVKPVDCGGPLVDLEGRVVGINICRAGRTESWAVPSEVVQALLKDLKSGKLAPRAEKIETSKTAGENAAEELLGLMKERLSLVEGVARAKWNAGSPIADAKREGRLLASRVEDAAALGLDRDLVRAFLEGQLAASKKYQAGLFEKFKKDGVKEFPKVADLRRELRPRIDQIDREMVATLARLVPHLREKAVQERLRRDGENLLGPDFDAEVRRLALAALLRNDRK